MSTFEYDPQTGLPKGQQKLNNPPSQSPFFHATGVSGAQGGATGYGTAGAQGPGATSLPGWQDFLNNDPFWRQFNQDLNAQGIADEAAAKAATQRAIIGFGEAPADLTGQAASWIDQTTRDLAAQNTAAGLSQKARIDKFNTDQIRQIRNALAARGGLRSGEFGYQLKENQGAYERAQYDSRQALTDTMMGIQAGLAAAQRQAAMARAQALGSVVNNYYGGGGGGGTGGTGGGGGGTPSAPVATPPASGQYSAQYGTPGFRKPLLFGDENPL